ncbi:phage portal protein [Paenibacillus agilis]|uniref:Phage portal protein n=1 Tax=Paenibacillus agilis TaxID=3020863 RepID=A0A559IX77_9BACL|nr:phage portal protein [Paenibacillus agilis]TVX92213.1 phage portal protein [Paenibacillus agilis]
MAVVNKIPQLLDIHATLTEAQAAAEAWVTTNSAWLAKLLKDHQELIKTQNVELYQATYDGELEEVENRDKSRGDDVNHKIMASMAQLVVDTPVDYLLGKPIVWSFKDPKQVGADTATMEDYRKELLQLLETEDAQRVLRETLTQGGVAGVSSVIGWVDESGKIDYEEFPYQEIVPVFDTRGRLRLVVRFYLVDNAEPDAAQEDFRYKAEIYDNRYITSVTADESGESYSLDNDEGLAVIDHKAGRIPVAVFLNGTPARYSERKKKAGVSDLAGGILSLVNEYAHSMSDKANAVDRMQDQLLKLIGVQLGNQKSGEAEVLAMRKARAIALKNENANAEYISPSQEDTAVENHLNRTRDTIHEMAFVPKLSDLSGATATEIKVKYSGLDIKAGKKETYFKSAIKQLLAILTDFLNARKLAGNGQLPQGYQDKLQDPAANGLYDSEWVEFTLNRNLPQNYLEIAQIVSLLTDKVPDSYLYELLWFIPDPKAALDEMKAQKDAASKRTSQAGLAAMGLGGEFSKTNVTENEDEDGEESGESREA